LGEVIKFLHYRNSKSDSCITSKSRVYEIFTNSTKFSNKIGNLIKIHVITRDDSINRLFPISVSLSKSNLIIPHGGGNFYGDEEYDDKEVLNKVVKSGYNSIIKRAKKRSEKL